MQIIKLILQGLMFIGTIFSLISFMGCMGSQDDNKRNSSILLMTVSVLLIVLLQHYWV